MKRIDVPVTFQGMVDPGEQISLTLQREFSEEALNSLVVSTSERAQIHERITQLFKSPGFEVRKLGPPLTFLLTRFYSFCEDNNSIVPPLLLQVFKGYVDDPRNTDNAWMETVAVNFHDDSGINPSDFFFFFCVNFSHKLLCG